MIGLSGAGLGAGLSSMANRSGSDGNALTHHVAVKYVGLYRNYMKQKDYATIKNFLTKKLNIPLERGMYQEYLKEMGKILGTNNNDSIELPGVIVHFTRTEIRIATNE